MKTTLNNPPKEMKTVSAEDSVSVNHLPPKNSSKISLRAFYSPSIRETLSKWEIDPSKLFDALEKREGDLSTTF